MGTKRHCRCSWKICKGKFQRLSVFLCHFCISHNAPYLLPTFIQHSFHFSWVLQPSQEKLKSMLNMQNCFGANKVHYGKYGSGTCHDFLNAYVSPVAVAKKASLCAWNLAKARKKPTVLQSRVTTDNGLYREVLPERGTFFRLLVCERLRNSLVEVYERVGKSVNAICKKCVWE